MHHESGERVRGIRIDMRRTRFHREMFCSLLFHAHIIIRGIKVTGVGRPKDRSSTRTCLRFRRAMRWFVCTETPFSWSLDHFFRAWPRDWEISNKQVICPWSKKGDALCPLHSGRGIKPTWHLLLLLCLLFGDQMHINATKGCSIINLFNLGTIVKLKYFPCFLFLNLSSQLKTTSI